MEKISGDFALTKTLATLVLAFAHLVPTGSKAEETVLTRTDIIVNRVLLQKNPHLSIRRLSQYEHTLHEEDIHDLAAGPHVDIQDREYLKQVRHHLDRIMRDNLRTTADNFFLRVKELNLGDQAAVLGFEKEITGLLERLNKAIDEKTKLIEKYAENLSLTSNLHDFKVLNPTNPEATRKSFERAWNRKPEWREGVKLFVEYFLNDKTPNAFLNFSAISDLNTARRTTTLRGKTLTKLLLDLDECRKKHLLDASCFYSKEVQFFHRKFEAAYAALIEKDLERANRAIQYLQMAKGDGKYVMELFKLRNDLADLKAQKDTLTVLSAYVSEYKEGLKILGLAKQNAKPTGAKAGSKPGESTGKPFINYDYLKNNRFQPLRQ
jgi:hypothetical protein